MKHECPDLIPVLAELARRAWQNIKTLASKIYELVQPPSDLKVHSTRGHEYTGVIMVDHNEVEGGAVARVGFDPAKASGPYNGGGTLVTPAPRYSDREQSPYLKSWAEDPRQEEEPWRYR
jgi:hypothetical protein